MSKPLAYCLSFSWASSLVDLYAAFQTDYWSMLFTTFGVRVTMTIIALAACAHMTRRQHSHDELVAKLGQPSREAVPPVSTVPCVPPQRTELEDADVPPPITESDLERPPDFVETGSDMITGDIPQSRQPVMG